MTTTQKCLALTIATIIVTLSLISDAQADKRKRGNSSSSRNNSNRNSSNQTRTKKYQNNQSTNNNKGVFKRNNNQKQNSNRNQNNNNKQNTNNKQNKNEKWNFNKKRNTNNNQTFRNNTDLWKGNQKKYDRNHKWSQHNHLIREGKNKGKYKWHSGVYRSYRPYHKNNYTPQKYGFEFTYRRQQTAYKNPYCVPVVVNPSLQIAVDNPAPVFDDSVQLAGQENLVTETDTGKDSFGQAREAFFAGDLKSASSSIEQAAKEMPGNPNVQQFRSLVLFAQKDYNKSAAAAYTALTIGPGWDWETLQSLFPSAEIYTSLLRALEEDMAKDETVTSKKFLLAYHYLMLGYKEAASKQLAVVVDAEPNNEVALQLFKTLGGTPKAKEIAPPPKPGK